MLPVCSVTYVTVHDPSIVYDPNTEYYYIVGSHMARAKSKDLVNWTNISPGTNGVNLFGSICTTAFSKCPEHQVVVARGYEEQEVTMPSYNAGGYCSIYSTTNEGEWIRGNMWGPDLIYNKDMKKWCLYMSLNGNNWASTIVLLTSTSPTGPFKYEAPIIFGGFNGQSYDINGVYKSVNYKDTDLELVIGEQSSLPSRFNTNAWGTYYPNCIDPCVFYDDNDELWMSYGSWSGGIYLIKLNKETGLRDYTYTYTGTTRNAKANSDQYFGKKIAGGYYVSGEGAYIKKIGKYYYLFITYGGLEAYKGYEMRVFRASSATGPYVDASNKTALYTDVNNWVLNYGANAVTNRGMRLMSAYNKWGDITIGERAQGHNSAIVTEDGKAFVCYHTRYNNKTEWHNIRLHQLFVNENGWLVAAPFSYEGDTISQSTIETKRLYSPKQIEGDYSILVHPYKQNHDEGEESTPVNIHLSADGNITGSYTGSWKYTKESTSFIRLYLNNMGLFYGVVAEQTVSGKGYKRLCMTAICNTSTSSYVGVPVWLQKTSATTTIYGDSNDDGVVTMSDANIVVNKFLGLAESFLYFMQADVNKDGEITMSDANAIVNIFLGKQE